MPFLESLASEHSRRPPCSAEGCRRTAWPLAHDMHVGSSLLGMPCTWRVCSNLERPHLRVTAAMVALAVPTYSGGTRRGKQGPTCTACTGAPCQECGQCPLCRPKPSTQQASQCSGQDNRLRPFRPIQIVRHVRSNSFSPWFNSVGSGVHFERERLAMPADACSICTCLVPELFAGLWRDQAALHRGGPGGGQGGAHLRRTR